jgi:zinc protease
MAKLIIFLLSLLFPLASAVAGTVPISITTPKGISVWYLHDKTTPSISISFAFRGGTEEDAAATQGTTALMADLLTESAGGLSATAFQQQLADHNITLNISANREAVRGRIRFLLRHQSVATRLVNSALTQPAFTADDIDRMRQTTLASLNSAATDPAWQAQRLAMQQIFAGTPYAQAAGGTPTTLAAITRADIISAHQRHIVRQRLVVTVVGAASADDTARMVDAIFGSLPIGTPWQPASLQLQNGSTVWYHPQPSAKQSHILFAAPTLPPTDPDYAAAMVLNDIYGGGGFRALLMDELRQTLGATYGASTGIMPLNAVPTMLGRTAVAAPATADAMNIISTLWDSLRDKITADAFAASVAFLSNSIARDLTSAAAIADYYLGLRLNDLPPDYAEQLPLQLKALDENTLHRVAERLYRPGVLSFAVVGPVLPVGTARTVTNLWSAR